MVPSSKNSLGSNTESLCFWSIDEFWGWEKNWNYRKVEPDSRISGKWTISFPSLPLSQAFLPVALLCIPGYTFAVGPSPVTRQWGQNVSFHFSGSFAICEKIWHFSCWLYIYSTAALLRLPTYHFFGLFLLLLLFLKISMTVDKDSSI